MFGIPYLQHTQQATKEPINFTNLLKVNADESAFMFASRENLAGKANFLHHRMEKKGQHMYLWSESSRSKTKATFCPTTFTKSFQSTKLESQVNYKYRLKKSTRFEKSSKLASA